jgi:hypothetical protein
MNELRAWARDGDLFGGREIGHSFLILIVSWLLLESVGVLRSGDVRRARASEPSSVKKRPDAGTERVVSDDEHQIPSVDFVQSLRAERS